MLVFLPLMFAFLLSLLMLLAQFQKACHFRLLASRNELNVIEDFSVSSRREV
jgi:flagellar biogenesis protein FliO